jgi:tricorn protease-like protein
MRMPEGVNPGHPFALGKRVYFVSDHAGTPNLFSAEIPEGGRGVT